MVNVRHSPRGRGPKNSYGFRHGTAAALVSDLIAARPISTSSLREAVEREFGKQTDSQFGSLVDFVLTKLRRNGFSVKREKFLVIEVPVGNSVLKVE
jgi:hypothetical protein